MIGGSDILTLLTEQCTTVQSVEDPSRLEPLERESLPAVTVRLIGEEPGFTPLSGLARASLRRYEVRVTASDEDSLREARAEIHDLLTSPSSAANSEWASDFNGLATDHIHFLGGEMIALESGALQWRDLYRVSGCEAPTPIPEPTP